MSEAVDWEGSSCGGMSNGRSSSTGSVLLGKYQLGRILGVGSFAKVYHARNLTTGHSVAIKSVSKHKVLRANLSAHVKREISIMRRLRHPHILRLHEVLATKSNIFFVIDFAKGGELFTKVAKGRFAEHLSRKYFHQLISAVAYCHSHGVFHRDLKPENLLLDDNWDLKVTDFGLSAVTEQIRPDGLLHTLCGTPSYVAPEVLAKKGYDGAKVDVWSCGVILYLLNAGYLPFHDPNLMVMYRKIYRGEFRCPKWTSAELKSLLTRLLDANPETRITIDEILRDPWFRKGFREIKPLCGSEFDDAVFKSEEVGNNNYLNAFDIISSGLDISNLLKFKSDGGDGAVEGDRFVSAEQPETIAEKIEEVAKREGVRVVKNRKGGMGMRLEGQSGNFVGLVEINRLTDKLVMVEVKKKEAGGACASAAGSGFWKGKLRPQLNCLVYKPEEPVAGS